MNIPLIDLKRQMKALEKELTPKVLEVLYDTSYIMGKNVLSFEKEFAAYIGAEHAVSVANGTEGLVLALKALGIGQGDEVITTPFTFFATAESIAQVGAVPVFVDVKRDSFNMDPAKIEEKITDRTKAILPVHIFGTCADMDSICAVAKKHGLLVIEDACQAAGASYKGKKAGSMGDIGVFSFFPTKNLGGAGDGGMLVTHDESLAVRMKAYRMHGSGENGQRAYNDIHGIQEEVKADTSKDNTVYNPLKYYNYLIGHNSRLDEIQAAILRVKLPRLDEWNDRRRALAKRYNDALEDVLTVPRYKTDEGAIYHLYIVQSEERDKMTKKLGEKGIATGVYYPVPLHLQKAFGDLGYRKGDLPVGEYLSERTFALPMFPEMTEEEQDYIIESVRA
ncbi:pleiotropic regulatory protein DegT domain protein [Peptostreptococcaceae bacterium oral taxon 113 str. W5053]|nr:pleiotropic regulatory protein DegT domain protein [Peptostreptococcaceae bacterium oral taxon 113 str. W5053]